MSHRVALIAAAGVAAGALILATHVSAAPHAGKTIVWSSPAANQAQTTPGSEPVPQAPSAASPTPGPLSSIPGPLAGIFGALDREAKQTAGGQYTILQEISGTLRGWIEHLLNSAPAGR
jgi:hypothetical protein